MEGIYYKDGVYIIIDHDANHENCIFHAKSKTLVSLYGGRVSLRKKGYHKNALITVDGIELVRFVKASTSNEHFTEVLNLSTVVQYLNAIEANGVDAFMQNYKQCIEFLYDELTELRQRIELELTTSQDDIKRSESLIKLERIKEILLQTLSALFTLKTFISAGLENEKVISVYQSIMETIA